MPIDPNIANPKIFQMPDAMDGMGKALTNALMMEKMRGLGDERQRNAMLDEVYKATGGDRTKMKAEVINRGLGRHVPELEKQWYEADEAQAKVGKATAETSKTRADTLKSNLPVPLNRKGKDLFLDLESEKETREPRRLVREPKNPRRERDAEEKPRRSLFAPLFSKIEREEPDESDDATPDRVFKA